MLMHENSQAKFILASNELRHSFTYRVPNYDFLTIDNKKL